MSRKHSAASDERLRRLFCAGFTRLEIAVAMGIPEGTAASWARRLGMSREGSGKRGSLRAQFEAFVLPEPNSGCWLWDGALRCGYGVMSVGGRNKLATHVSLHLAGRDVPAGLFACHHCDNRSCVNPDHLFVGTRAENMRDMAQKGRARGARGERHRSARLTAEQVGEIKDLVNSGLTATAIAQQFGVAHSTIHNIAAGRTWRHLDDRRAVAPNHCLPSMARERAPADRGQPE